MNNLSYIKQYAMEDASISGVPLPSLEGLDDDWKIIELARFMSEHGSLGDPGDVIKRNLAIRAMIEFPVDAIRSFGLQWLERHRHAHGNAPWFCEWQEILQSASNDALARIYLSSDQESTRRRLSRPTGMLGYDVSLSVKRSGYPI